MVDLERTAANQPSPCDSSLHDAIGTKSIDEQLAGLPSTLEAALASDKRERVIHYLEAVLAVAVPERSPFYVGRDNLMSTRVFSEEELARLSDEDIAEIGSRMQEHFRQDWYDEEIVFHAQQMLDEKEPALTQ
ncbi:MAG: hypothetical protein KC547_21000 [Anaerolineae bacterium]|nr:hypothetical protein [Anaerolineae bacterium]